MTKKQIVAGSGGFIYEQDRWWPGPIVDYLIKLSKKSKPRICFIGTATGDDLQVVSKFYDALSDAKVEASHLQLFPMPNHDPRMHLLSQDVIWVGGGSVANLLAVWRVHGLDQILREAWDKGTILGGISAGSICWGQGGTTDSFGKDLRVIHDGLGLLPYSSGVHYDSEPQRQPLFTKSIGSGELVEGYATDDGVALHFEGEKLVRVLSDTPGKHAYHVYKDKHDALIEDKLQPELLV